MHSLNPVGTRVLELADGSLTIAEIAERLTQEFDVTEDEAETDMQDFVQTLTDKGMITIE